MDADSIHGDSGEYIGSLYVSEQLWKFEIRDVSLT